MEDWSGSAASPFSVPLSLPTALNQPSESVQLQHHSTSQLQLHLKVTDLTNGSEGSSNTGESQWLWRNASNNGHLLLLFALLVLINLIVILGNILVILAVYASAKLRNVTNLFIVSLATADLLLGIFVLPYALMFEILDVWIFGRHWCRGWLVTDVWISTASILSLCAISVDRYVAVTRPVKYRSIMTPRRARTIVAGVWITAFLICCPPLLSQWNPSPPPPVSSEAPTAPLPELASLPDSANSMGRFPPQAEAQIGLHNTESSEQRADNSARGGRGVAEKPTSVVSAQSVQLRDLIKNQHETPNGSSAVDAPLAANVVKRRGRRRRRRWLRCWRRRRRKRRWSWQQQQQQPTVSHMTQSAAQNNSLMAIDNKQQTTATTQLLNRSAHNGTVLPTALPTVSPTTTFQLNRPSLGADQKCALQCAPEATLSADSLNRQQQQQQQYEFIVSRLTAHKVANNQQPPTTTTTTDGRSHYYYAAIKGAAMQPVGMKSSPSSGGCAGDFTAADFSRLDDHHEELVDKSLQTTELFSQPIRATNNNNNSSNGSKSSAVAAQAISQPNDALPRSSSLKSPRRKDKLHLFSANDCSALLVRARQLIVMDLTTNNNSSPGALTQRFHCALRSNDLRPLDYYSPDSLTSSSTKSAPSTKAPLHLQLWPGDRDIDYHIDYHATDGQLCAELHSLSGANNEQLIGQQPWSLSLTWRPCGAHLEADKGQSGERRVRRQSQFDSEIATTTRSLSLPEMVSQSPSAAADSVSGRKKLGCALFENKPYVIYSALGSFYIPMLIMIFFYSRIYLVASRAHKAMQRGYMTTKWRPSSSQQRDSNGHSGQVSSGGERVTLRIHRREKGSTSGAAVISEFSEANTLTDTLQQQVKLSAQDEPELLKLSSLEQQARCNKPETISRPTEHVQQEQTPSAAPVPSATQVQVDAVVDAQQTAPEPNLKTQSSSAINRSVSPDKSPQRHAHHHRRRKSSERRCARCRKTKQAARPLMRGSIAEECATGNAEVAPPDGARKRGGSDTIGLSAAPLPDDEGDLLGSINSVNSVQITVSHYDDDDDDDDDVRDGRVTAAASALPLVAICPPTNETTNETAVGKEEKFVSETIAQPEHRKSFDDRRHLEQQITRSDRSQSCGPAPTIVISWNPDGSNSSEDVASSAITSVPALALDKRAQSSQEVRITGATFESPKTTSSAANTQLLVEHSALNTGSQSSGLSLAQLPGQVRKQSMMLLSTLTTRSSQTLRRLSMVASHPVESLLHKRSRSHDSTGSGGDNEHRCTHLSDSGGGDDADNQDPGKGKRRRRKRKGATTKRTIDDYLMAVAGVDTSSSSSSSDDDDDQHLTGEDESLDEDDEELENTTLADEDSLNYSLLFGGGGSRRDTPDHLSTSKPITPTTAGGPLPFVSVATTATATASARPSSPISVAQQQRQVVAHSAGAQVVEILRPSSGLQRKGAYYERATSRAAAIAPELRSGIAASADGKLNLVAPAGAVGAGSAQTRTFLSGVRVVRRRGAKRTSRWHAKRLHAETKAAKTVAIIIGGFIFCWLPFFTAYLSRAIICQQPDCIPQSLLSLFIWLGYLNSAINPVIYGLFSADFRHAFKNIVCRCRFRGTDETVVVSVLVDSIIKSIL